MTGLLNIKTLINRNERIRVFLYRLAMRFLVVPYVTSLKKPIIAITGTNGKTTVTKLLDRIYSNAGYSVGTCTTSGVYHKGVLVYKGDESGGGGVWKASHCPNVDLLILETARKGIIDYGIGFEKCNVGVVTNIHEDHLNYNGINSIEEMAELKSIVIKHTKKEGAIVLNGDDLLVRGMAEKSYARKIYFMMENDYNQFNNVFYFKDGFVCKKIGIDNEKLMHVNDIAITIDGKLTYNIRNAMAALAAVEGMNKFIPIDEHIVKNTLIEFGSSLSDNIERFVMGNIYGGNFICCNSKNPEGYSNDIQFIMKIKEEEGFDHVVGILSAAGNRNKKHYIAISKLVAPVCDLFYIYPPRKEYLRGRSGEEIVKLLSNNIPKQKIISNGKFSLSEIIYFSNNYLKGKKIFIVFSCRLLLDINLEQFGKEGKFFNYFVN